MDGGFAACRGPARCNDRAVPGGLGGVGRLLHSLPDSERLPGDRRRRGAPGRAGPDRQADRAGAARRGGALRGPRPDAAPDRFARSRRGGGSGRAAARDPLRVRISLDAGEVRAGRPPDSLDVPLHPARLVGRAPRVVPECEGKVSAFGGDADSAEPLDRGSRVAARSGGGECPGRAGWGRPLRRLSPVRPAGPGSAPPWVPVRGGAVGRPGREGDRAPDRAPALGHGRRAGQHADLQPDAVGARRCVLHL
jgi:hypothetical protein